MILQYGTLFVDHYNTMLVFCYILSNLFGSNDDHCLILFQYVPDILVCDEAHMIKNTRADITQALKQVKTQRRIALTGSPLQNNLMEYYCVSSLSFSL